MVGVDFLPFLATGVSKEVTVAEVVGGRRISCAEEVKKSYLLTTRLHVRFATSTLNCLLSGIL